MTGVHSSVSPVDTMASHFRKINMRLASLERVASTGAPLALETRIAQLEARIAALEALNPPPS